MAERTEPSQGSPPQAVPRSGALRDILLPLADATTQQPLPKGARGRASLWIPGSSSIPEPGTEGTAHTGAGGLGEAPQHIPTLYLKSINSYKYLYNPFGRSLFSMEIVALRSPLPVTNTVYCEHSLESI